ncbi:MAG TPA: glycosyltransferase family 1 protein [Candidatus Limnocylindrales bacterium]|nr:glycosyltransferase family 1 protein [Candidatus Limnocylindrales bacterium]
MPDDLLCFSHLRWGFVTQRPNHLMTRAARGRRVFFIEEPVIDEEPVARVPLEIERADGVLVVRPHIGSATPPERHEAVLRSRLDGLVSSFGIRRPVRWYYTPMALPWSEHVPASAVVYDCMDELSLFHGAPPALVEREQRLLASADLVFTGGQSLWRTKRRQHPRVAAFPSSVDAAHFRRARRPGLEPHDQAGIPGPRIGWFGVIDERFDMPLVEALADRRPDWQLVMLGPVVKIDEAAIPRRPNLHWLGQKAYDELPDYLRGWDVAVMPFARNDATRFISPTKTPEYLAAGRPVVSTSITDVVEPYAALDLVRIADDPAGFEAAVEAALGEDLAALRARADAFLATTSWDATWARMDSVVRSVTERALVAPARPAPVPAAPIAASSMPPAVPASGSIARARRQPAAGSGVQVAATQGLPSLEP